MNLRSLKLFRQIVLTGSLSEASRNLHLSASAASRLLSILEHEVKLTLFSRTKRKLELTEDGDLFYRSIANTLDGLEAIPSVSSDIRNRSTNWLSVVTSAPIAQTLVSPALARMQSDYAEFQCSLNVESRFDIESRIAARSYNVGIISLPVENAILDLEVEPFMRSRIEVMLPNHHPLAQNERISIEELSEEQFVALRPLQRWRERLDEIFGVAGFQPRVAFETSSTVVTTQLVRDGLGITLIDRATARLYQNDSVVLRPLVEDHWLTYANLYAAGPRTRLSQTFIDAVIQHINEECARDSGAAAGLQLI